MAERPLVVAFDMVGTVFSLETIIPHFRKIGLPSESLGLWFTQILSEGFALAAAGDYAPLSSLRESTLNRLMREHGIVPRRADIEDILQAFDWLRPHEDAEPAMKALRGANIRVVALTNGEMGATKILLGRGGLDRYVESVFSADEVKRWKPNPEAYLHTARRVGVRPEQLAMVSVHGWDVMGARRAGLTTGWASRLEKELLPEFGAVDAMGTDLMEVVEQLLTLPVPLGTAP